MTTKRKPLDPRLVAALARRLAKPVAAQVQDETTRDLERLVRHVLRQEFNNYAEELRQLVGTELVRRWLTARPLQRRRAGDTDDYPKGARRT